MRFSASTVWRRGRRTSRVSDALLDSAHVVRNGGWLVDLEHSWGATLTIRRALAADVPAIVRLVNAAYRVEAFFVDGDRTDAVEIARRLASGATFLLAERDGTPVGSALVENRRDHGYIGLVSVDPALQGAGIGRALMAAGEAACRADGLPRVELVVVNLREELPPWYRRLGYREVGTRPFPDDTRRKRACHFIVMSKRLSPCAHVSGGAADAR